MFLTGNKDADLVILSNLNDKDLLSVCSVNQKANQLCQNEYFWMNRFRKNFGETISKYKPTNMTWRNIYLRAIKDINMDANELKNLPGLIIVWDDFITSRKFIQYCKDIENTKGYVLIINSGIRSEMGFANTRCPICKVSYFEAVEEITSNFNYKLDKVQKTCFVKDILNIESKLNGIPFTILTKSPLVKGKCGHVYHNSCINYWRRKRENCPVDGGFWYPILMDSYITGRFEKI